MVVDASVWISRFVPQDVHHAISRRWLEQYLLAGNQVASPTLLLAEVGGAIARRTGQSLAGYAAMRYLLRLPGVQLMYLDDQLSLAAATLAVDVHLRGADAVYVAVAPSHLLRGTGSSGRARRD